MHPNNASLLRTLRTALALALSLALPLKAAGPMGHFIMGTHMADGIEKGTIQAPLELKGLLKDDACKRSFNGGTVGPDICEEKSHYGNTAEIAAKLMDGARAHMKQAAGKRDQADFQAAKQELAFAYGWYSHCAEDLNVHPRVNARVGDTFRFLDKGGKLAHGEAEAQLTAYLKQTVWNPKNKYDVSIPYEFLSRYVSMSPAELKNMNRIVNSKAAAELVAASKVTLTHEQLKAIWEACIRGAFEDCRTFINNPKELKNWDLDCGRITSEEFDKLRDEVKALNGGKLPEGWGKNYLAWYAALKGLTGEARQAKLRQLLGLPPVKPTVLTVKPGSPNAAMLAVLAKTDLIGVSGYGHIIETTDGKVTKDHWENIGVPNMSGFVGSVGKLTRVKWSGTSFTINAEGEATGYAGRKLKAYVRIQGSISSDGQTLTNVTAEEYYFEQGSNEYRTKIQFGNLPFDAEEFKQWGPRGTVSFTAKGPRASGKSETSFIPLDGNGNPKSGGHVKRVMDFNGNKYVPQTSVTFGKAN